MRNICFCLCENFSVATERSRRRCWSRRTGDRLLRLTPAQAKRKGDSAKSLQQQQTFSAICLALHVPHSNSVPVCVCQCVCVCVTLCVYVLCVSFCLLLLLCCCCCCFYFVHYELCRCRGAQPPKSQRPPISQRLPRNQRAAVASNCFCSGRDIC